RYDAKGQLVEQVVDPAGLALSTRYAYDAQGHTLEVIRPEGTRTRYTYDGAGRRISEQVDPDGLNLKRTYTYDLLDNLTSSVDANGNTSYYLYDDENRQTLAIDGSGSVKQTSYDALGRISKLVEYRNPFTDTALL
ncbi:RHS repeat protein, partial [Myxococcus xanthus]|nr:RHS repeat protein [Myxococcus xanthus]